MSHGAWTARWADMVVLLEANDDGWRAKVWLWPQGKSTSARTELASQAKMATHEEAIKWACQVMRDHGAIVMVLDAPAITLESMLKFTPAPQAVA